MAITFEELTKVTPVTTQSGDVASLQTSLAKPKMSLNAFPHDDAHGGLLSYSTTI